MAAKRKQVWCVFGVSEPGQETLLHIFEDPDDARRWIARVEPALKSVLQGKLFLRAQSVIPAGWIKK